MIKLAYISQIMVFISFHLYGMVHQSLQLINEGDDGKLASILNFGDIFSSPLPFHIAQYIAVSVLLTLLFISSQARFSIYLSSKVQGHINNRNTSIVLWAIVSNGALFIVNSAWFMHSVHLTQWFNTWPAIHLNTYFCWLIIVLPIAWFIWSKKSLAITRISIAACFILLLAFSISSNKNITSNADITTEKPHVIMIGIDSLRGDLLHSHMPFLSEQLQESTLFENTYTPLGRTFPAWNSILTGLYPINHGARVNLMDERHLPPTDQYLGSVLKKQGYKTLFAIDETRFANMGTRHGFDEVISPRMGASDFIVGVIADYPLTNLLSLLPISAWLLPEIYANRGVAATYRAEAFSDLLERNIPVATQPSFLAIHFCLAHWPFYFSTNYPLDWNYPEPYYPANLRAIDDQIESLMIDLKNKGYLANSRIIFLSDHGEAWTEESPTFTNKDELDTANAVHNPTIYGHGSSLTSHSNRTLLAFKGFQDATLIDNSYKMASLADIKPTILSELDITTPATNDGRSLLDVNLTEQITMPVETGTILTVNEDNELDVETLRNKMLNRYQLNPSGLLSIREDKIATALKAKINGVRTHNQVLSQFDKGSFRLFNIQAMQFEHFKNLHELKDKSPLWAQAWCHWYKSEDTECSEP